MKSHAQLNEMAKTRPLRYIDIDDGLLAKHVGAFTYFRTSTQNDAFLECINIKPRGLDDPGVCSRLIRYSASVNRERKGLAIHRASGEGLRLGGRPRVLHWKDEYLVYSIYVHVDMTEKNIGVVLRTNDSWTCVAVSELILSGCTHDMRGLRAF